MGNTQQGGVPPGPPRSGQIPGQAGGQPPNGYPAGAGGAPSEMGYATASAGYGQQQQQQQNVRFTAGGDAVRAASARHQDLDDNAATVDDEAEDDNIRVTTKEEEEEENNEHDNTKESDDTKSSSIYEYLDEYLGEEEDDDEGGGGGGEFLAASGGSGDDDDDADFTYDEDNANGIAAAAAATTTRSTASSSSDAVLASRLRDLTTAVEKFATVQERTLQVRTDEKGRAVTNSAMDLLRQSSTVVPGGGGGDGEATQQQEQQQQLLPRQQQQQQSQDRMTMPDVALVVLLTEMKCEMTNVREALAEESGDQGNRARQKLEAVTKMFERLEGMLIDTSGDGGGASDRGRNKDVAYENDLPVATNVANMYETPSRMFTSGELSPVPGCKDGDVTALDVTLTLSPDRTTFDDDAEDDAHSSPAEEQQVVPIEPVGREALSRAIDILADPVEHKDDAAVKACAQMLYLYVVNLSSNVSSKRYRRVYTTNANFKNKVGAVPGGLDVLESVGFVDKGAFMEWEGDINESEESAGLALLNEAAAQLSILKVVGRKRDVATGDRVTTPIVSPSHTPSDITTPRPRSETPQPPGAPPRHRSETPPPFGAPPRPSVGVASSASGSASGSAGSYTSGSDAAIHSVTSPSGFTTPRMRGDGNDRFVTSPADSIASSNLLCSPPVIKQLPSGQDGVAEQLFGTVNRNDSHTGKQDNEHGLGFPSAPQLTAGGAGKSSESDGGIFRTTKKILPPRGPSAGTISAKNDRGQVSGAMATGKDSVIGAQGSAFMRRAGSSVSDSAAATEGGGIKLKLRRSAASEDDAEFAPRRASDPNVDHISADTPFAVPVAKRDDEPAMYFNLSAMGTENGDGEPLSPGSNYSPSTLDYTQSPLNTSLISMRTDITEADTPSRGSEN
mmetsp:Transcript_27098/g.58788  ORF Transcript_27098/g.58788 Transcript_27098/m.58788 type:complete len:902 (-) Transcript_27098:812-3517(-)